MSLVNLDIADDDSGPYPTSDAVSQAPCIYLTAAQVKALGITEPPRAGARLSLQGQCIVESATESIDGDMDDPDVRLTLVLEYAEVGAADAQRDPGKALYG